MTSIILQIDRWLLNNLFKRKRIFFVDPNNCIDENGFTYGNKGSHFFIQILKLRKDKKKIKTFLKEFYKKNKIKSVNQILKKNIGHKYGDCYFLPWDAGRVRDLKIFEKSYKIGPTPEFLLDEIVNRLLNIFNKISSFGFHPFIFNNYPRVIKVIINNNTKYLIRDGNHRLACLSFLNYKRIPVCYEADYWKPSALILLIRKLLKKNDLFFKHSKIFQIKDVDHWPHVKESVITKKDAIKLFNYYYNKKYDY